MHIAFYNTSMPEPHRKPGGVDATVERLAERLVERGHQLDLYTYSPRPVDAAYGHFQLQPSHIRYNKLGRMFVAPILLNRLRSTADVLHVHGDDWFFLRRRLPTVRTFYGSALWEARTASRLRRQLASRLIFGGEILASRLATASYDIAPGTGSAYKTVGTLPPAVEVLDGQVPRAKRPTVLFIGTWTGRKRGWLLAQAFTREVLPRLPNAKLVMISDYAEASPGIEHIARPSNSEVQRLMQEAWVLCLPSTYEGFGIPYAEALAAGTPVVATRNVGSEYVLDGGQAGIISEDQDLGADILKLLLDPELSARYRWRGRKQALNFSWERVLELHERAYEDAIERYVARHMGFEPH